MWQVNLKPPSHFLSPMVKARAKPDPTGVQMQLKVALLDIKPAIWRRLLVPATIKLPKLHTVLQLSFGWTNSHLHAFRLEEDSYEAIYADDWSQDFSGPGQRHDEKKFRLCDLLHAPDDFLIYEYDFGDSWQHEILVEKILPGATTKVVSCIAGARAGPPDDCGSIPGYENLVEAMADPEHPEREQLLEWLGRPYKPEAFSLVTLNKLLKGLKI
jgi:hypothetical protein